MGCGKCQHRPRGLSCALGKVSIGPLEHHGHWAVGKANISPGEHHGSVKYLEILL